MMWLSVPLAYIIDLVVGDPIALPHPVRVIGAAITGTEKWLRTITTSTSRERRAGILLALLIPGTAAATTWGLCYLADAVHSILGLLVSAWLISTTIASRDLVEAGSKVYNHLCKSEYNQARSVVDGIVGRDTDKMNETEMIRATVETMAENIVDGVVAPIIYAFIGGAPLAMAYRAVNTLDSMVGYRNERYLYFGWASARLDDFANYIPARITGVFIVIAAAMWERRASDALQAIKRDSRKHPSPNSGIPEAGVAGALGVQLGGTNYYEGVPSLRPRLGLPLRDLNRGDIRRVSRFIYSAGILAVVSGVCLYIVIIG